jgi:hypothetical protein
MTQAIAKKVDKFANIDPNQPATYKQITGVAILFSSEGFKALGPKAKPNYRLMPQIRGTIYGCHKETPITHSDIQTLRQMKRLPKRYRDAFNPNYVKPVTGTSNPVLSPADAAKLLKGG